MPIGPGKYDDWATRVREGTRAEAVLLIIARGSLGDGFSVQLTDPVFFATLPQVLRAVAKEIESTVEFTVPRRKR